jgi:methyl-accepting chemotaxis protein
LARSQFFTALALLVLLALAGLAANEAALLAIALAVGFVLAWISATAAADRLVDTLAALPIEPRDEVLLERLVQLIESGGMRSVAPTSALPGEAALTHLAVAIEEATQAVIESVSRLADSAAALAETMRQSADTIEHASRSIPEPSVVLGSASAELQAVSEQLGRAVRSAAAGARALRLTAAKSASAADRTSPAHPVAVPPELGGELRQLLSEFG